MTINKLCIEQNSLKVSVSISCPFDINVSSPKAKIFFEYESETRRLPFLVQNYFKQKSGESCIIVCSYVYNLDNIFLNFKDFTSLSARIDLFYGDYEVKSIPFCVSSNVMHDNPELEVDEKFIEYESVEGVTVFDSEEIVDTADNGKVGIYSFILNPENGEIIISKGKSEKVKKKSLFASPEFQYIFKIMRMAFSVILAPVLLFIAFIAGVFSAPFRHKSVKAAVSEKILSVYSAFIGEDAEQSLLGKITIKVIKTLNYGKRKYRKKYEKLCKQEIVPNRITFMSGRRDVIGGNYEFVYNLIKDRKDIDFQFLMFSDPAGHDRSRNIKRFLELYSTSKVVIVDDYFRLLNDVPKRKGVTVIQLWHACGAFKSFGFTRLGKKGGPKQTSPNHRMYDYAIVSSKEIAKHYAEGFGISDKNVVATGVPRTDVFMDKEYAENIRNNFYARYPKLKDKKIVLFAPTFRGDGQMSAYYPKSAFHPQRVINAIGEDYVILLKLHPFCKERFEIPEELKDRIIDLSDADEINDLLFVTDLLITDYSSVIFEASLLDIPMLFYAYDLYLYIKNRDFYYDFESFVPGKIVFSENELINSIKRNDFNQEKIHGFKNKFFDQLDGKSSQRVAELVLSCLDNNSEMEK